MLIKHFIENFFLNVFFFDFVVQQKLEEYRESESKGEKLNEDQQTAVNRYDEVIRSLELAKELEKQFVGLASDVSNLNPYQIINKLTVLLFPDSSFTWEILEKAIFIIFLNNF